MMRHHHNSKMNSDVIDTSFGKPTATIVGHSSKLNNANPVAKVQPMQQQCAPSPQPSQWSNVHCFSTTSQCQTSGEPEVMVMPMAPLGIEQLKCKSNIAQEGAMTSCNYVNYGFIEPLMPTVSQHSAVNNCDVSSVNVTCSKASVKNNALKYDHISNNDHDSLNEDSSSISSEPTASSSSTSNSSSSSSTSLDFAQCNSKYSRSAERSRRRNKVRNSTRNMAPPPSLANSLPASNHSTLSINHHRSKSIQKNPFTSLEQRNLYDLESTKNSIDNEIKLDEKNAQAPGSPWRKYLPLPAGQLRMNSHRISAQNNLASEVLAWKHPTDSTEGGNGHLSDSECGRRGPATRESLSYSQAVCSPMVQRRVAANKFHSLEKNLKLSSIDVHPQLVGPLLRRQASFLMPEKSTGARLLETRNDLFGSSLSVASCSTAPSLKIDNTSVGGQEMRKLRRELQLSHQKVGTLTSQLNTNAHMVNAFEQSLAAMNARLQQLSNLSEQKDVEVQRLRTVIQQLTPLNTMNQINSNQINAERIDSSVLVKQDKSIKRPCSLVRRHTFASEEFRKPKVINDQTDAAPINRSHRNPNRNEEETDSHMSKNSWLRASFSKAFRKQKQCPPNNEASLKTAEQWTTSNENDFQNVIQCEQMRSLLKEKEAQLTEARLESLNGAHQLDALRELVEQLRNELSSVHQENERLSKLMQHKSLASSKSSIHSSSSLVAPANSAPIAVSNSNSCSSTLPGSNTTAMPPANFTVATSGFSDLVVSSTSTPGLAAVMASTTSSNIPTCSSTPSIMTASLQSPSACSLRHQLVSSTSSCSASSGESRLSSSGALAEMSTISEHEELVLACGGCEQPDTSITLLSLCLPHWSGSMSRGEEVLCIGKLRITNSQDWRTLDNQVQVQMAQYLSLIDCDRTLGVMPASFRSYIVGDQERFLSDDCNQSIEDQNSGTEPSLQLCIAKAEERVWLKANSLEDSFCLHTQVPRCTLLRFLAILGQQKRVLLHGPAGAGKTRLASQLAEFLAVRNGNAIEGAVASFKITEYNHNELAEYASSLAEQYAALQCDISLPLVLVLDDLHLVKHPEQALSSLITLRANHTPYIISTMNESRTPSSLAPSFRLMACAAHMEPVRGHLSRSLRRAALEQHLQEARCGCALIVGGCSASASARKNLCNMLHIANWLVRVWAHVNHFLELHHSSAVTLGPRVFAAMPTKNVEAISTWFEQLWNVSIAPYIEQAARDGLRKHGLNVQFEDPSEWVERTCPWRPRSNTLDSLSSVNSNVSIGKSLNLRKIQAQDTQEIEIQLDNHRQSNPMVDSLTETLNKLQKFTTISEN